MPDNAFGVAPQIWQKIQQLRLLDDLLMQTAMDGFIPGVELILRIILDMPELTVTELTVQKLLPHVLSRKVTLDVKAVDAEGQHYNIEVQRSDSGATPRRPRYHSALMDVQFLQKGMKVAALPESYVVFITENDVLGAGLPVYHIDRVVAETGKLFDDGAHIVYANGAYKADDAVGHLMADFRARDPDEMHYSVLAEQVRTVKSNQKGVREMSQVLLEMRQEGYDEGYGEGYGKAVAKLLLRMMLRNDWTLQQAMEVAGIPLEEKAHFEELIAALPEG